jgi:hypothetical protein
MKTFSVFIAYTGYVSARVEAENEDAAKQMVEDMGTAGIGDFSRWPEADMADEELN